MHRCETVPAIPRAAGRRSPVGRGPRGAGGSGDRHEVCDEKVRQAADALDQQPFPQDQRQTGETLLQLRPVGAWPRTSSPAPHNINKIKIHSRGGGTVGNVVFKENNKRKLSIRTNTLCSKMMIVFYSDFLTLHESGTFENEQIKKG